MSPVEKLRDLCETCDLQLDIQSGRYGVCLDGQDGSTVWLWNDGSISVESATPCAMVEVAARIRELDLLERETYEEIEKHRDQLREDILKRETSEAIAKHRDQREESEQ